MLKRNAVLALFAGHSILRKCNKNCILNNHHLNYGLHFYFCNNIPLLTFDFMLICYAKYLADV